METTNPLVDVAGGRWRIDISIGNSMSLTPTAVAAARHLPMSVLEFVLKLILAVKLFFRTNVFCSYSINIQSI